MDYDPAEDTVDTEKMRLGLWTNDYRNDLIAKDAKRYDDKTQVLIVCETLEHAVHLKSRLTNFKLAYRENGMSATDRRHYVGNGLLSPSEPMMTVERRAQLTKAFTDGRLRKVICTTIWNVGVDFPKLGVLIRADGTSSAIGSTQIPGPRVADL